MLKKYILVLVVVWLSFTGFVFGSHIVGGELNYKYLSDDKYELTLVVYRDCFNGVPNFDDPACITVFDTAGQIVRTLRISFSNLVVDTVPLWVNDECTALDSTICYERGTYKSIYNLPPIPGGYKLIYDRCCWNFDVRNIYNPPNVNGLAITAHIPDTATYQNSNPVFKDLTPPFLCLNQPFEFDHSAFDIDGDSLVYDLFTPLNVATLDSVDICPLQDNPDTLKYNPGYSVIDFLGPGTSINPLRIDPQTGLLTAVPEFLGQYVFGVRVKEYRDGKYLSQITRSYQLNVKECQRLTHAFFDDIDQCDDTVVQFTNNSLKYSGAFWNFGDPDAGANNTSNSINPIHHYTKPGTYTVMLIAKSVAGNTCDDTTYGTVEIFPEFFGDFEWEDRECDNFVQFYDRTSDSTGKIKYWYWDFGDGETSLLQDPFHLYDLDDTPKSFNVSLIVKNENDCSDTIFDVYRGVNSQYKIDDVYAQNDIIYPRRDSTVLTAEATNAVSYDWTPKNSLSDPDKYQTYAKPTVTTTYTVLVTDDRGCQDKEQITIEVFEYSCGETEIYIPNAFSPNGDGENDFLRLRGEKVSELTLEVYNRWGEKVFESNDVNMLQEASRGWDGRVNGVLQDPGVFVYVAKVRCSNSYEFTKSGNVTLIR